MPLPPAIFFVNADLNDGIKNKLITQLFINEVMTGTEFDARVSVDPNYPDIVHLQGFRILVIRPDFRDYTNRSLADVVMFVKQGLVSIEKNNFGPPALTYQIDRMNIYDLLRFNNSPNVVIIPTTSGPPGGHGLGGIFAIEASDTSGVHCANTDNEYNNPDFINRK